MNEQLTKELNALQEKFNKEIEDVKKKYEKVTLKAGDWVKLKENYGSELKAGMVFQIVKPQTEDCYCYIIDHVAFGIHDSNYLAPFEYALTPATPEEVEKALIKEAVNRYENKTVLNLITDRDVDPYKQSKLSLDRFYYQSKVNKLYHSVTEDWSILIFDNGVWSDVIKEKTLDEIAEDFDKYVTTSERFYSVDFKTYLTENKEEIINALNKL